MVRALNHRPPELLLKEDFTEKCISAEAFISFTVIS